MLYKYYTKNLEDIYDLKHGVISISDLYNLSPNEFENWCTLFLETQGYSNMELSPLGPDGGKDIICYKGSEKFYVECKRYGHSFNSDFKVNLEIARKLIGTMEGNGINNGIIITSGIISDEAMDYFMSLPNKFNIVIFHGNDLVRSSTGLEDFTPNICEQ